MPQVSIPNNYMPRPYQFPVWEHMMQDKERLRASMVWHRRGGKDLTSINLCAAKAFQRVGTYWHLLPTYKQGRQIVWEGMRKDGIPFLDAFPGHDSPGSADSVVKRKDNVEMQLDLINGSKFRVVGCDKIDSLVGTNPIGCVFSEYSLQDPKVWDYIRPILAENGGWALFIFTPRGRNHGFKLHEMAQANETWFDSILTVNDTNAIPLSAIDEEREAGMPEELIQQEFFCSFEAPLVGAYYSNQMQSVHLEGRITSVPWEPALPVNTYWDLGIGDDTCIWFTQEIGNEIRVIDYYESSGEGLVHYLKKLKEKDYVYGVHYGPHDLNVREFTSGKRRIDTARSLGVKFKLVKKHTVLDGIEAVRGILPRCYFDKQKCEQGIEALRSYRKEYDEKNKCYRDNPLHDWSSHAADGFRMLGMSYKGIKNRRKGKQKTAQDDFNYL